MRIISSITATSGALAVALTTIAACWRCNTDPDETRRVATGLYEIDFTPLATDVSGRPRSATLDNVNHFLPPPLGIIALAESSVDRSIIIVDIRDPSDTGVNAPFTMIVY